MKKKIFLLILLLNFSCKENISYTELEIIDLNKNSFENEIIEINKGNKAEITANIIMKDGRKNNEVIWESENEKIVKIIENGLIEAMNVGETSIKIYAKDDKNIFTKLKIRVLPEKETSILSSDYSFLENKKDEKKEDEGKIIKGYVKDIYNNIVKDVDIKINYDKKFFTYFSKDGYFEFKNIPEDTLLILEAKKSGFTTRKITEVFKKSSNNFYEVNFENDYALKDDPEIISISINNKKIYGGVDIENFEDIQDNINNEIKFSKLNYVNISFLFSENVDKSFFENSFEVLVIKENKEKFFINKSNEKIQFNWLNNFSNLVINLPTKYNINFGKTLYRVQFKNGISDLNSNISNKNIFNFTGTNKNKYSGFVFSIY